MTSRRRQDETPLPEPKYSLLLMLLLALGPVAPDQAPPAIPDKAPPALCTTL
ncbi:hypothetical protein [Micromonospora sp. KC207]|uniref:hypothetical protein n=1 Tax=Micromonospora sp. KC207 TaxID=2530377 RepID=UPI0014048C6E|nr:hypothetical protein [Micromonospora sp. KC207]